MRLSTTLWGGLVAGVLLVGLPGGVTGLDGGAVAQTIEDRNVEAARLWDEGHEYFQAGNYQSALEKLQQAYAIYEEIEDLGGIISTSLLMGDVFIGLGETERARSIFQGLLDFAIETDFERLEEQARQGLQVRIQVAGMREGMETCSGEAVAIKACFKKLNTERP